jgi:hypothetical protein
LRKPAVQAFASTVHQNYFMPLRRDSGNLPKDAHPDAGVLQNTPAQFDRNPQFTALLSQACAFIESMHNVEILQCLTGCPFA